MYKKLMRVKPEFYAYFAWLVSICATLGSLYYSQVLGLVPCTLCWYQRIMMYPLSYILLVAILLKEKKLFYYIAGPALIGLGISFFHVLLSTGILPEQYSKCFFGPSCTTDFSAYFGFFTVPIQSFTAFTLILLSSRLHFLTARNSSEDSK